MGDVYPSDWPTSLSSASSALPPRWANGRENATGWPADGEDPGDGESRPVPPGDLPEGGSLEAPASLPHGLAGHWHHLPAGLQAALGRAWLEVDMDVLATNVAVVRRYLRPETRLMAVVKGDAYGFGAEMVARTLLAAGAQWLGTATLDEALRLRQAGIDAPLLVFTPPESHQLVHWLRHGLVMVAHRAETVAAAAQAAARCPWRGPAGADGVSPGSLPIHLEVDLGFGRGGLSPEAIPGLLQEARRRWPQVTIQGLFAQVPTASRPRAARSQLQRFRQLVERLTASGLRPPLVHCAESHLLVRVPDAQFDMVRLGNLLYGFASRAARAAGLSVASPGRLMVRVTSIHEAASRSPGYRGNWGRSCTRVAVLSVGLADGLRPVREGRAGWDRWVAFARRLLAALGGPPPAATPRLRVRGREVLFRGEFMMNHCLFDATGLDVVPGEPVELLVGRLTASAHLPLVYRRGGRVVAVSWPERRLFHVPPDPEAGGTSDQRL